MCGRFFFSSTEEDIEVAYQVEIAEESSNRRPKGDIRITDEAYVITADEPGKAQLMHFGLIAWYAKSPVMERDTFNAKAENLLDSRLWSPLVIHHKRCIVISDGFSEPEKIAKGNTQHWKFTLKDSKFVSMAGLWSEWKDKITGSVYRSFAIITVKANSTVGEVHEKQRMPAILDKETAQKWLSKEYTPEQYVAMLVTLPDDQINREKTFKPGDKDKPKKPPEEPPHTQPAPPDLFS